MERMEYLTTKLYIFFPIKEIELAQHVVTYLINVILNQTTYLINVILTQTTASLYTTTI